MNTFTKWFTKYVEY